VGQIERGEDYPRLNQVIFIGILDFAAFTGTDYLTRHLILNTRTQVQELKDLEFTFIELPKFTKDEAELETLLEKWIYFIKHASDLEMVPASADHAALQAAYDIANTFGWSRNELEVYEYWSMRVQDERGAIEFAEERGMRHGLQRGRQEGEVVGLQRGRQEGEVVGLQRGKEETARKMLAKGYDVAEVADLTGLTGEEVAALVGAATPPPEA
jgi:predicted transposase/invertase (TIGR01784 family)